MSEESGSRQPLSTTLNETVMPSVVTEGMQEESRKELSAFFDKLETLIAEEKIRLGVVKEPEHPHKIKDATQGTVWGMAIGGAVGIMYAMQKALENNELHISIVELTLASQGLATMLGLLGVAKLARKVVDDRSSDVATLLPAGAAFVGALVAAGNTDLFIEAYNGVARAVTDLGFLQPK